MSWLLAMENLFVEEEEGCLVFCVEDKSGEKSNPSLCFVG